MISTYHIKPGNIYNFDEKGFLLGLIQASKRIVSTAALRSKRIIGVSQDGNREFISLLAAICADGTALPPALIYQGESGDLQDSWLEDFDSSREEAFFAVSDKGWTNDDLGFSWVTKIFEPQTREKAGNARRLLIVDGHSSHVNLRYINFCDKNNIIVVILPPHSTHRLQPLDVGIFSPLATAYSKEIDNLVQSSMGFSRVTKRSFWRLFRAAWNNALTSDNIVSAFKTPGIYPVDESRVLSKLPKTSTPPESDEERSWATPRNVPALRRTVRAYHKGDIDEDLGVDLIIRGAEKLAIENEILKHETKGLRTALVEEAKRHKRGKAMGLIDKERPGDAQFFSPSKVTAARARAEQKESDKEEAKMRKEEERLARIAERDRKAREVQDRKEQRERGRLERERRKQQEQELRQITAQARSDSQTANKGRNKGKQPMLPPLTRSTEQGEASSENQQETQTTRSGRQFRRPKRFEA